MRSSYILYPNSNTHWRLFLSGQDADHTVEVRVEGPLAGTNAGISFDLVFSRIQYMFS